MASRYCFSVSDWPALRDSMSLLVAVLTASLAFLECAETANSDCCAKLGLYLASPERRQHRSQLFFVKTNGEKISYALLSERFQRLMRFAGIYREHGIR